MRKTFAEKTSEMRASASMVGLPPACSSFAGCRAAFAEKRMIAAPPLVSIGIEAHVMRHPQASFFSFKAIASTILVIAAFASIILASRAGIIPIGGLQRFWPLALVAVGLLDLISWQERKDS